MEPKLRGRCPTRGYRFWIMRKKWGLVGEVLPESMKRAWSGELCIHQLEKSSQVSNLTKETGTNHYLTVSGDTNGGEGQSTVCRERGLLRRFKYSS